jgi:hypothetical protein
MELRKSLFRKQGTDMFEKIGRAEQYGNVAVELGFLLSEQ